MIKLTVKNHSINTNQVDAYGLKQYMNYYANCEATIYYRNNQGWQKMSAAVANKYSHILTYCEWIIIDSTPKAAIAA